LDSEKHVIGGVDAERAQLMGSFKWSILVNFGLMDE